MHFHSRNAMIFIRCIIINSPVGVTARGIDGDFIAAVFHGATPSLLLYAAEDMEELIDACLLGFAGYGIVFNESRPDES